jgi:hypothetical protein
MLFHLGTNRWIRYFVEIVECVRLGNKLVQGLHLSIPEYNGSREIQVAHLVEIHCRLVGLSFAGKIINYFHIRNRNTLGFKDRTISMFIISCSCMFMCRVHSNAAVMEGRRGHFALTA